MTELSNRIYRYYTSGWNQLPKDKQFHFASRLYLWNQDAQAKLLLDDLRAYYTAGENVSQAFLGIIADATASPAHGSKNAAELRRPYFEHYPRLKMYVSVLFRLHFLLTVYGMDCRDELRQLFDLEELEQLKAALLADAPALAMLSTHAINFLYLFERTVKSNDKGLPIERFLEVGHSEYKTTDKLHLQLLIYLYTHCIIGDSRFYYRVPPAGLLPLYRKMIAELEQLIADHFDNINLDNKCEFLVCAKLVGQRSKLERRIVAEANASLSPDGIFLIDRHNHNPQPDNVSIDKSEHRNVLFLMANRDFKPRT